MAERSDRWEPPLPEARGPVTGAGVTLSLCPLPRQTVLSGPVGNCLALAGQAGATGWPEPAAGDSYALRLRRDRILVVNGPDLADGWVGRSGVAVSDMTGAYVVFEITGPRALEILATGTELDPGLASGSVMRRFHRQEGLLYRWQDFDTYRVHVQRWHFDAMWRLLAELVAT